LSGFIHILLHLTPFGMNIAPLLKMEKFVRISINLNPAPVGNGKRRVFAGKMVELNGVCLRSKNIGDEFFLPLHWEYHFASSDSICSIIFVQDRVARTECRPLEGR
jgi:hypothetical protein